jgi:hypothetical protein
MKCPMVIYYVLNLFPKFPYVLNSNTFFFHMFYGKSSCELYRQPTNEKKNIMSILWVARQALKKCNKLNVAQFFMQKNHTCLQGCLTRN